jgi:hypothetical protein
MKHTSVTAVSFGGKRLAARGQRQSIVSTYDDVPSFSTGQVF